MKNNSDSKRIVQSYMKQKIRLNRTIKTLQLKHWITALFQYIHIKQ